MSQNAPTTDDATPKEQELSVLFNKDFVRLLALQSAFGVSFSSFLLLPKFLRVELGASASAIGWMAGIALGASALSAPFVGLAVRRYPTRKLLAIAIFMESSAAFGFTLVEHVGIYSFLLRLMQGLSYVVVFNTTTALVAETAPRRQLARALGYMGVSLLITNALAPLLAEPVATAFGWNAVFVLAGSVAALTLILVKRLPQVDPPKRDAPELHDRGSVLPALPAHYGSLVMGAGIGVMFTFVQPFALEQGATDVGQFFLGYALTAAGVRVFFGGLADRIGNARMAALSMILYATIVAMTSELTPSTMWLFGVGLGVSHGFLYPALSAAGIFSVSRRARPLFLGWFSCGFNSGFAFAVLAMGPVADHLGFPAIFQAVGVALASAVLPLFRFSKAQNAWPH